MRYSMIDLILITIILLVIGTVTWYIYKEKKQGNKCIGCPNAKNCNKNICKDC